MIAKRKLSRRTSRRPFPISLVSRWSPWRSDYAPGAASPSHTHAKSAFIYAYVISGAIESKVNDGETQIYRAGESWSEPPGAMHSISRNASKTEPAKLLAVFVLDTNDNPLTTPIK